jgi:hypothetical protein
MNITMIRTQRIATGIALVLLVGACVRVGNIQQTEPIRTLSFTGSARSMALCVQQRLGGQMQEESLANRYVIFDAVKGEQRNFGITHYSITVAQAGANQGVVTWRVVRPPEAGMSSPGGSVATGDPLQAAAQKYWTTVEQCAAQVKTSP